MTSQDKKTHLIERLLKMDRKKLENVLFGYVKEKKNELLIQKEKEKNRKSFLTRKKVKQLVNERKKVIGMKLFRLSDWIKKDCK